LINPDALTRPEGYVEKRDRRRIMALLVSSGGCEYCTQRVEGWGAFGCSHGQAFPLCTKGRRPRFELDDEKVGEVIGA